MASQYNEIVDDMKVAWHNSWLKNLFRFTALGRLSSQVERPSPEVFFQSYLSSWWWNRLWFRGFVINQYPAFDPLTDGARILQKNNIFNHENISLIVAHNKPDELVYDLSHLDRVGILNLDNFNIVAEHAYPNELTVVWHFLQQARLLSTENRDVVVAHADLHNLAAALSSLHEVGILTQVHFNLVVVHAYPCALASSLSSLQKVGILSSENRHVVVADPDPRDLSCTLTFLENARILSPENFNVVAAHANPDALGNILFSLQEARILSQESFNVVVAHANPSDLRNILSALQRAGILSPENRNIVAAHANPNVLAGVLCSLRNTRILTQDNFNTLLLPVHAALLADQAAARVWGWIPEHLFTQDNFHRLLQASEQANPEQALEILANEMIGHVLEVDAGQVPVVNPAQSTHTASVHQSVSESAIKLMQEYGPSLELENMIEEMNTYIQSLNDSPKHQAAKNAIERLSHAAYVFQDQTSGVSIKQLLALSWRAIHDDAKRQGTLVDAKAMFVEGLYEIQRGYNLDAQGHDDEGRDRAICVAGTFNKLIEKLQGIHDDVRVLYITKASAAHKLPIVVKEKVLDYLKAASSKRIEDFKSNPDITDEIWAEIKESVKTAMEDFSSAFAGDLEFEAFIDAGQDTSITAIDIEAIQQAHLLSRQGMFSSSSSQDDQYASQMGPVHR